MQFIITEIVCVKDLVTRVNELESFKAVNEQVSLELKSENKRLQERLDKLSNAIDDQEQRNRNNCLLLHGVEELDGENTDDVVLKIINEKLELPIVLQNIHRSHRLSPRNASRNTRQNPTKPRAIIFRFKDFRARQSVFYNKKMLKGTDISITENLTKKRHTLYKHAVAKYGLGKIWTIEGRVTTKIDYKIFVIKGVFIWRKTFPGRFQIFPGRFVDQLENTFILKFTLYERKLSRVSKIFPGRYINPLASSRED